jgi:iron complex transport system substrate-binding protein
MKGSFQFVLAFLVILAALSGTALGNQNGYDILSKNFTLKIFGNANLDNTIDENDIAYIEGVVSRSNKQTSLADANYDGKIDSQDIDQIKKIISGEDSELTIIDAANRTVTIKKPIESVISLRGYDAEIIHMMGEQEKINGIANWMATKTFYKASVPELTKLPTIGTWAEMDYEKVIALNPDLIITATYYGNETVSHLPSAIPVACFDFTTPENMREEMTKIGYLFNKKGWEKSYFDDFHDKYMSLILSRTKNLSKTKKPTVYKEWNNKAYNTFPYAANQQMTEFAGGKLLFSEMKTNRSTIEVSPEDILMRDPDVVLKDAYSPGNGYTGFDIDDPQKPKPLWDEIMNRTELSNVSAVKNNRVYILDTGIGFGAIYPVGVAYLAKWLHPELFEDLDPKDILQEYMNLLGSDYDAKEHGVFVYPPLEN